MQIFTDTKFDFLGKRSWGIGISGLLLAAALYAMFFQGFNLGIDFVGGTEMELRFAERPDLPDIRARLASLPDGDVNLQRVGRPEENTVLIRVRTTGDEETDISERIVEALYTPEERAANAAGKRNLNLVAKDAVASVLRGCGVAGVDPDATAAVIIAQRTREGVLRSYESLESGAGVSPDLRSCLEGQTFLAGFATWKDYFVGPKVGSELRTKAFWAIIAALIGILLYVTFRFHFEYALGAVLALFHDVIITTGLLVLLGEEFSLTVVAALLTLAGYSVNDTIVVFDRIRENLRLKRNAPLAEVMNASINQTLSRTVLTALSTCLVLVTMLLFGGAEFHGFSIALLIGIVLGTYSSIFVASPLVLLWHSRVAGARLRRRTARA